MKLTVVNIGKRVAASEFQQAIDAANHQLLHHFTPEWSIAATVRGLASDIGKDKAPIEGNNDIIIYFGDSSQDPTTGVDNALGYHYFNHASVPYGFVYLDICEQAHESWSVTLTHEIMELLVDPTCATVQVGPDPKGDGRSISTRRCAIPCKAIGTTPWG